MAIAVFIENPAGLSSKHPYDERRGVLRAVSEVSRPNTGEAVDCAVLGLMEQREDGVVDHNLIARPSGETGQLTEAIQATLVDFVSQFFDQIPVKMVRVGRFLDAKEANAHLVALQRP